MARREPLGVWLYGHRVAELTSNRPGEVICRYTEEALDTWPRNTPLLSCSLPLGSRPQKASLYFRGMLPEGQHLQALAAEANVATYDTFGLLARFGRDVAGAAVIATSDPGPRPGGVQPYTGEGLADEVAGLADRPLAVYADSELSIAGLQNKMLLVDLGDGWGRPVGGRPSTHILKLEDRRYPGLVTMEAACLRLARAVGLTTVDASVETFAGLDCLIVSRFDRVGSTDGIGRVHQEDSCQALGRDPEAARGRGKYEQAGGPRLVEIARLFDRFADVPLTELARLVAATTFNVVVGNADAHGKNVSLLHVQPGVVALAPLYDTVPTALWPKLPKLAAMKVNGHARLAGITIDDIVGEAGAWPLGAAPAIEAATSTAEGVLAALREIQVPEELSRLVEKRCASFLRGCGEQARIGRHTPTQGDVSPSD